MTAVHPTPLAPGWLTALAVCLLGVPLAVIVPAQSQARLTELRDGKLQLPYLKHVAWHLEFTAAQQQATKTGKLIFAYFTRSDTRCMNSLSLECGVFAEPGFKAFCERVVPYCNITTKVKGDKDQQLFRLKGGAAEDFPMVVFMDATGRVLYRVKGETLGDFEKGLAMLDEIAALQRKVAAGDRSAPLPLLLKQLELHHIDFPAAKKAVKKIPQLTKAQKRELAPYLLESEVFYLVGQGAASDKALAKTGERFFRMKQKGEIPTRDARLPFWKCIMVYAHQREKVDLYEEALDTLKQEYPDMKFPAQERILLELRDKQGDP